MQSCEPQRTGAHSRRPGNGPQVLALVPPKQTATREAVRSCRQRPTRPGIRISPRPTLESGGRLPFLFALSVVVKKTLQLFEFARTRRASFQKSCDKSCSAAAEYPLDQVIDDSTISLSGSGGGSVKKGLSHRTLLPNHHPFVLQSLEEGAHGRMGHRTISHHPLADGSSRQLAVLPQAGQHLQLGVRELILVHASTIPAADSGSKVVRMSGHRQPVASNQTPLAIHHMQVYLRR